MGTQRQVSVMMLERLKNNSGCAGHKGGVYECEGVGGGDTETGLHEDVRETWLCWTQR